MTYIISVPLLTLLIFCNPAFVQAAVSGTDSIRIHTDLPALNEQQQLTADVFFETTIAHPKAFIHYRCFKFNPKGDSLLICEKRTKDISLPSGMHKQSLRFTGGTDDPHTYAVPIFSQILKKTGIVPPGSYRIRIDLQTDSILLTRSFSYQVDSALPPTAPLRKELSQTLLPENKTSVLGINFSGEARSLNSTAGNVTKVLDRTAGKIDRLYRSKGLTSVIVKGPEQDYINLYYEDWFIGRYELVVSQNISRQLKQQQQQLTAPITSLASTELENYQSLFSQVKSFTKQKKGERALTGELGLTGNWANGQQEYSEQDNNYYELRGHIETTIQDIPIGIDGYYPYGMLMKGRSWNAGKSIYGYNGKKNDNEVYGVGNWQDYGERMYNPRLARFPNVDPFTNQYPELTPYQFASNTPIQAVDFDGLEAMFVHGTFSDPTTWNPKFMKSMLHATKWDKTPNSGYTFKWSGGNNDRARQNAASSMVSWLFSDKNPLRDLKHATLIGHSHGGNVNKIIKERMEILGWKVDVINIETPQRSDYKGGNYGEGKGMYINFYSPNDAVQYMGAFGKNGSSGPRIDPNAKINYNLLTPTCPTDNPDAGYTGTAGSLGHSVHNDENAQKVIIDITKRAFDNSGNSTTTPKTKTSSN